MNGMGPFNRLGENLMWIIMVFAGDKSYVKHFESRRSAIDFIYYNQINDKNISYMLNYSPN